MADSRANTASIVDRIHPVAAGLPVVAAHFLGHTAVFVLGEEALLLVRPKGKPQRVAVHGGAILATAADGERVVSGGDDGKVVATDAKGETRTLATDAKHRWIDHIALAPSGAVAWSAGKTAFAQARHSANSKRPPPSAALPSYRRASGSRSPTTTAPRSGFPTRRRPYRKSSNGKARISARPSVPTAASSSPPCRSPCCTAGALPTASTCACPAMQHACDVARLDDRRALARDFRRERSSSSGRSMAKTAPWAKNRLCWRRPSSASQRSPAIRGRRSSPPAYTTAWCC